MSPKGRYGAALDDLPKDWRTVQVSQLGQVISGGTPSREVPGYWGGDIPWLTPGELTSLKSKNIKQTNESITEQGLNGSGANLLPAGSLLITTRATLGARAINTVPMATNQGFKSIVFKNPKDADYYYYWAEKLEFELIRRASGTTFLEISGSQFCQISVPYPPEREQERIAQILGTLDTQIHRTEALIAKLERIRQGMLTDLLTRGIDQNGQLRPTADHAPHLYQDSPLGRIPTEWEVTCVGNVGDIVTGSTPPSSDPAAWGDSLPFFTPADVVGYEPIQTAERAISERGQRYIRKVPAGSILVVCIGSTIGKVGFTACSGATNQQINAVLPSSPWDDYFVFHAVLAYVGQIRAWAGLQAVPIVNKSTFSTMLIPQPRLEEQKAISEKIRAFDKRISGEEAAMEKLSEKKSGLMDDLLKGRVRVTPLIEVQDRVTA